MAPPATIQKYRDDVLDDGREKVWLDRPADAPDLVNDLLQPPIPRLEAFHLLLAVSEVHKIINATLTNRLFKVLSLLLRS